MILFVHSLCDVAGINIANHVLNICEFSKTVQSFQNHPIYEAEVNGKKFVFITLEEEAVYSQTLLESFPSAEFVIFLSRHSSKSGTPTLSVHTPGNFGLAELGGLPRTLSVAPAKAMRDALLTLNRFKENLSLRYEVSYECTHHGPSFSIPVMFVELGSSMAQWNDNVAASVVAQAAVYSGSRFGCSSENAALGIGGPHYNPKFTRMALEGQASFGHMIAKYAVSLIDSEVLQQCLERTFERVTSVVLDWKGIKSEDKPKLLKILADLDLSVYKV
jgi:D-aminoacyl-tRNA deacylase